MSLLQIGLMALLVCLFVGTFITAARRGPTFAGIIAVVFGYALSRYSPPRDTIVSHAFTVIAIDSMAAWPDLRNGRGSG